MEMKKTPNPDVVFPIPNINTVTYVKPTLKNRNIIVGDFTYFADTDFEKHVTHHYDFYGDKLIIGKFCQIAKDVEFIMNGVNHQMNAVSTFPFYIFEGWEQEIPPLEKMPLKGDTIIGNDVWIGQNTTILPGVHIGDGVIIGAGSVVGKNIEPYCIVAGNPAKVIKKRFDDELIDIMLKFKWWDLPIDEISGIIPILSDNNLENVKKQIKKRIAERDDLTKKPQVKLVSFDLDDTLTREIHSVLLPCILNGKEKECRDIDEREESGEIDYISADYLKAGLFEGLAEKKINDSFLKISKPLKNIRYVVEMLHKSNIMTIVITVGPKQVARVVSEIYGFDEYYGSDYETENGIFTGRIREYLSAENKTKCIMDFCGRNNISPAECVAVGDGSTDIPVFEFCGKSIALNAKHDVKIRADYAVDSQDLADILPYIIGDI
jgi:virginiamycin A acetyltransferase